MAVFRFDSSTSWKLVTIYCSFLNSISNPWVPNWIFLLFFPMKVHKIQLQTEPKMKMSVSAWKSPKKVPRVRKCRRICRILNVFKVFKINTLLIITDARITNFRGREYRGQILRFQRFRKKGSYKPKKNVEVWCHILKNSPTYVNRICYTSTRIFKRKFHTQRYWLSFLILMSINFTTNRLT